MFIHVSSVLLAEKENYGEKRGMGLGNVASQTQANISHMSSTVECPNYNATDPTSPNGLILTAFNPIAIIYILFIFIYNIY